MSKPSNGDAPIKARIETVVVPLRKYRTLCEDVRFLACLEAAGVDSWEGYERAQELFNED